MQVVNKKMCVIVILVLVIIESCTLFLVYNSYGNKNNIFDEVNLNIDDTNMFVIMLEQEEGTYKEDTTSTCPPSGYTYNESMSGCIDINGNNEYTPTYGYDDNGEYGEVYDLININKTEQQFANSIQSKVSLMSHDDNLYTHNSEKSWLGDWEDLYDNDSNFPSSETTINLSKYLGFYDEFGPIHGEWGSSYNFDYMDYDGDGNSELAVIVDMIYISEYFSGISRFLPISAASTNAFWGLYESELQITKIELPARPVFLFK